MSAPTRIADGSVVAAGGLPGLLGKWREYRPVIIDAIVILALWQLSTLAFPPVVAPPLQDIATALWNIFTDPNNLVSLLVTALRVLVSLIVAFVAGTVLGVCMGLSTGVRTYAKPLLHLIQGIPALSWVVFAVIWFAQVELRIGFIIMIVTLPAFALYIDGAVQAVSLDWIQLAQAFRASRLQRLKMVIFPAIVPEIMSAWTVNLGNGVRVAVVAELIGSTVGVGFQLLQSQSVFDMAGAIAWTLSLVAMLFVYQGIVTLVERKLLSWRPHGEVA
jgi:ABC-type nitrate/sulfonate/bicarbonate transport system permease component